MSSDRNPPGRTRPAIDCDVAIVGAGPAGCAAAITARQAGLTVVQVEAHGVPARAPGETLHPGVEPIFRQLGVWSALEALGVHRHRGIWRQQGGQRTFAAYGADARGEWRGLQVDRGALDAILRRAAADAGARLFHGTPRELLRDATGGVVGIGLEAAVVRAQWTFDATGRRAWLASQLGCRAHRPGPPIRVRFGWHDLEPDDLDGQPLFEERSDGWRWRAPLGGGRTAWTELRVGGGTGAGGGLDMTWRLHRPCAGPGYFLLGDAAALLDPGASNGVLRALMSGILAAHAVAAERRGTVAGAHATAAYADWITAWFAHQETMLRAAYGLDATDANAGEIAPPVASPWAASGGGA